MQETVPREGRGGMPDGPTLFDFVNPLELRVEKTAADIKSEHQATTQEADTSEQRDIQHSVDDITAELVRLLERPARCSQSKEQARIGAIARLRIGNKLWVQRARY
jgi:hypothetical protein